MAMKFNSATPTSDVRVSMPQPSSFATRAGTYNVSNTYRVPPPSSSDGKNCGILLGIGCCGLAIAALVITNIVYSGFALSRSDGKVEAICPGSKLWVYLLVTLIITLVSGGATSKGAKDDEVCVQLCSLIASFIINAGLVGWGWYELLGRSCGSALFHNADTTLLYTMANIQVVIGSIGLGLIAIFIGSIMCKLCCCTK